MRNLLANGMTQEGTTTIKINNKTYLEITLEKFEEKVKSGVWVNTQTTKKFSCKGITKSFTRRLTKSSSINTIQELIVDVCIAKGYKCEALASKIAARKTEIRKEKRLKSNRDRIAKEFKKNEAKKLAKLEKKVATLIAKNKGSIKLSKLDKRLRDVLVELIEGLTVDTKFNREGLVSILNLFLQMGGKIGSYYSSDLANKYNLFVGCGFFQAR